MKTIGIRTHFLKIVVPLVGSVWLIVTCLFTWYDYKVNLHSRLASEELVAETFIAGIRQPLIQGSFLEAKIRADMLLKSKQVKCIEIKVSDQFIQSCNNFFTEGKQIQKVRMPIKLDESSNVEYASVSIFFDNSDLIASCMNRIATSAIVIAVIAWLLFVALTFGMNPVKKEIDLILAQAKEDPTVAISQKFRIREIGVVSTTLRDNMRMASQVVKANASLAIAKQVAHDIRSPLASLKILLEDIASKIPEAHNKALRSNVSRISEITSDLIEKNEKRVRRHFEIFCADEVCKEIISEKLRILYSAESVKISLNNYSKNSLISINKSDFRRVLSNLLDNSIDAVSEGGSIDITINADEHKMDLVINDNGKGISDDVLARLFRIGATYDKPHGNGLGLAHAKSTIESAGGKIGILSQIGVGTELRIQLPIANDKTENQVENTELNKQLDLVNI